MSKDKKAVNQAKAIDQIKLTVEERELLGVCGNESAIASETAKIKGQALRHNMEIIVVRKLLEVGLVELDTDTLPEGLTDLGVITMDDGTEMPFIPMSSNLFIPEDITVGTSVYQLLKKMIVSPASLFGKDDKDMTRPERSTLEACKRAFDSLTIVEPDEGHIYGLWTIPEPFTIEEKMAVSKRSTGLFSCDKDGKYHPITVKELIETAVISSASKTLDDSKKKKILSELFAEALKA
jgi:hypothetical protein